MKICKNESCGRSNPDDAKYCKGCGSAEFIIDNSSLSNNSSSDNDGWKLFGTIVVIAIAIGLGIASVGIATPVLVFGAIYSIKEIWKE